MGSARARRVESAMIYSGRFSAIIAVRSHVRPTAAAAKDISHSRSQFSLLDASEKKRTDQVGEIRDELLNIRWSSLKCLYRIYLLLCASGFPVYLDPSFGSQNLGGHRTLSRCSLVYHLSEALRERRGASSTDGPAIEHLANGHRGRSLYEFSPRRSYQSCAT